MKRLTAISIVLFLTGCASFTPQPGFKEVNHIFSSRTGAYLHWNSGTEEDKKVEQEITRLLTLPLTADSATQIALINNRQLQATYQNLGIAQAELVEAGLLPNPSIDGEVLFPSEGSTLELSIVQSFIRVLEIPLRKKIAESEFEEIKLRVVEQALKLAYQVRKAFYRYQSAEQSLELARTALIALEASKDLALRLHKAGNITELDLAQEQANYEMLKIEITKHEENLVKSRENINTLLGLNNQQINWKTADRLADPENNPVADSQIEQKALANNLELAKVRQELITLSASLDLAEQFRFFQGGEIGITGSKESDGKWGVGPNFDLPLPIFNQGQPEIYKFNSILIQKHEQAMDLVTRIQSAVRATSKKMEISKKRAVQYKNNLLPVQSRLVAESQRHYNAMLIGAFQLLQAKYQQINAGKDYIKSLEEYWLLRTDLESVMNGFLSEDIFDEGE